MKSLKEARTAAKLTQKQLAEKSGISLSACQSYERGTRMPKMDAVQKIAVALDTDPGELYYVSAEGMITFLRNSADAGDGIRGIRQDLRKNKENAQNLKRDLTILFNRLNHAGKLEALHRVSELGKVPEYQIETVTQRESNIAEVLNLSEFCDCFNHDTKMAIRTKTSEQTIETVNPENF